MSSFPTFGFRLTGTSVAASKKNWFLPASQVPTVGWNCWAVAHPLPLPVAHPNRVHGSLKASTPIGEADKQSSSRPSRARKRAKHRIPNSSPNPRQRRRSAGWVSEGGQERRQVVWRGRVAVLVLGGVRRRATERGRLRPEALFLGGRVGSSAP